MTDFLPSDLIQNMNPDSLRVHAPSTIVFLCGGVIGAPSEQPRMLRDTFYRIVPAAAPRYRVILAEDAEPLTAEAGYRDLFSFESDIAQLVGLILLFAESPGSLAELGAFAALKTVAPSLMAVLDDHFYSKVSFIRNGPIRYLENEYGEEWVLVLDRKEVGIDDSGSITNLNVPAFSATIFPAVEKRLSDRSVWSNFDPSSSGHAILLMTGLCQEFGALTITEIKAYLMNFNIILSETRLSNFVYCAQLLGWIKKVRKGHRIYYVAVPAEAALDYKVKPTFPRDKLRWRAETRAYWQKKDGPRFRAIIDTTAPSASTP